MSEEKIKDIIIRRGALHIIQGHKFYTEDSVKAALREALSTPPPLSERLEGGEGMKTAEDWFDKWQEKYCFQVPYDGSNKFYSDDRLKITRDTWEAMKAYSQSQRATMEWPTKEEFEKKLTELMQLEIKASIYGIHIVAGFIGFYEWLRSRGKEGK